MRDFSAVKCGALSMLLLIATTSLEAIGQATPEGKLKELENELAIQKARNDLFAARYPKFEGGKTGAVEGAEKLAGMAEQHLPRATALIGKQIATSLAIDQQNCAAGTVIISGEAVNDKMAMAFSFAKQIEHLQKEVGAASTSGVRFVGTGAIVAAVSALVSYAGMAKTDYAVASGEMDVDTDWLISSIVMSNSSIFESERFPSRSQIMKYTDILDALASDAQSISDPKKKKDLTARVAALRKAMLTPDASGILPLVTTALLSSVVSDSINLKKRKCLAFISETSASPMLLTKENMFSKGGKAFLHLPVQASVIQLSSDGVPVAMICKLATVSASIKLSDLTGTKRKAVPWSFAQTKEPMLDDCGSLPPPPKSPPKY